MVCFMDMSPFSDPARQLNYGPEYGRDVDVSHVAEVVVVLEYVPAIIPYSPVRVLPPAVIESPKNTTRSPSLNIAALAEAAAKTAAA